VAQEVGSSTMPHKARIRLVADTMRSMRAVC
jgi:adenylosuccinate lyase